MQKPRYRSIAWHYKTCCAFSNGARLCCGMCIQRKATPLFGGTRLHAGSRARHSRDGSVPERCNTKAVCLCRPGWAYVAPKQGEGARHANIRLLPGRPHFAWQAFCCQREKSMLAGFRSPSSAPFARASVMPALPPARMPLERFTSIPQICRGWMAHNSNGPSEWSCRAGLIPNFLRPTAL